LDGYGREIYKDGTYFIGHFKKGFKSGNGKLYNRDGAVQKFGNWTGNKLDADKRDEVEELNHSARHLM